MLPSLLSLREGRSWRSLVLLSSCTLALAVCCFVPTPGSAQEHKGAGLVVSGDVEAKDLGLPLYPGSRRHKDKSEDSPAANLGLWGGGSGFKLAVIKMESDDSVDKVSAYYLKALAKYGKVLDCSHLSSKDAAAEKNSSSKQLTCGDDRPETGTVMFKAGTNEQQHIVAVQPNGGGALYQIIYISAWSKDKKD